MPKYQLEIPHNLPLPDVRNRLKSAAPKLESKYQAQTSWKGEDQMVVSRKGLEAQVNVEPARLRIDLELGLLMSAMSGPIRDGITRQLAELLAERPAPGGEPT